MEPILDKLDTEDPIFFGRWDELFSDDMLNLIFNLVDETRRADEERRFYLATSLCLIHPLLADALEHENKGGRVASFSAERNDLDVTVADLMTMREIVQGEIVGDRDDRFSAFDYKKVRNAIMKFCLEIQSFINAEPKTPAMGMLGLLKTQIAIEAELNVNAESKPTSDILARTLAELTE